MHIPTRTHLTRRRVGRVAVGVAAILVVGLAGASTADANRGQPDHEVPIHGTFSGVDFAVPAMPGDRCYGLANDDGFYQLHYTSTGTARVAHLGVVELLVDHCTWVNDPLAPTNGSFGDGSMTIFAPNGDLLVLDQWGTFAFEGPYSIIDQYWAVNGDLSTGRFAGATGSGTGNPVSNLVEGTITGSMSGMIAYDASNRAGR